MCSGWPLENRLSGMAQGLKVLGYGGRGRGLDSVLGWYTVGYTTRFLFLGYTGIHGKKPKNPKQGTTKCRYVYQVSREHILIRAYLEAVLGLPTQLLSRIPMESPHLKLISTSWRTECYSPVVNTKSSSSLVATCVTYPDMVWIKMGPHQTKQKPNKPTNMYVNQE